ncbi:MAG TPA: hypothetical protein P5069_18390, partial [Candidatus Hydrogenedentes bacterium]|nr:hypothetical protein [Candidatus Hydrogenedentota bacterium]
MAATDKEQDVPGRATPGERALAVLCYLGVAPFLAGMVRRRGGPCLRTHRTQALMLAAVLAVTVLLFAAVVLGLSWMMAAHPDLYNRHSWEGTTLSVFRKLLIVWGVLWAYGVLSALRGGAAPIPWTERFSSLRAVSVVGLVGAWSLWALLLSMAACAAAVEMLAPRSVKSASATVLYENLEGRIPRALLAPGYLPTLAAARMKWGPGGVAFQPLTLDSLKQGAAESEFLFVGSHGTEDGLLLSTGPVTPEALQDVDRSGRLRFVYLAGCDSAALRDGWEKALAPANVVTQDHLASTLQHVWWLWRQGPGVIRGL